MYGISTSCHVTCSMMLSDVKSLLPRHYLPSFNPFIQCFLVMRPHSQGPMCFQDYSHWAIFPDGETSCDFFSQVQVRCYPTVLFTMTYFPVIFPEKSPGKIGTVTICRNSSKPKRKVSDKSRQCERAIRYSSVTASLRCLRTKRFVASFILSQIPASVVLST